MGTSSSKWWVLPRKLKSAVNKIEDMLIRRWRRIINSVLGGAPKWHWRRRHCTEEADGNESSSESDGNESNSESDGALERATRESFHCVGIGGGDKPYEYDCEEDNIDGRAENFIPNFQRRLQMERQVSLELRYSLVTE